MLYSILFPLKSHTSVWRTRIRLWTATCWILGALSSLPHLFFWDQVPIPDQFTESNATKFQCLIANVGNIQLLAAYQISHVLMVFYIPCVIILLSYGGIAISLFR